MPPILFPLERISIRPRFQTGSAKGTPAFLSPGAQLPTPVWIISGVTKDSAGAVLGSCVVQLFLTATDYFISELISDAATGAYEFRVGLGTGPYYLVAYKAGSPDVAGTTANVLVGA